MGSAAHSASNAEVKPKYPMTTRPEADSEILSRMSGGLRLEPPTTSAGRAPLGRVG